MHVWHKILGRAKVRSSHTSAFPDHTLSFKKQHLSPISLVNYYCYLLLLHLSIRHVLTVLQLRMTLYSNILFPSFEGKLISLMDRID